MKKTLSIIIPVYNVEQYLEQCLQSITKQITDSVEIIVINDGSPDNSASIINNYKNRYNNQIISVTQKNQGLSATRNNGIDLAKGDYIWFVDSDDWLTNDAISRVLNEIEDNKDVDVFSSYLTIYKEADGSFVNNCYEGSCKLSNVDYLKKKLPIGASQRYIYKRDFIMSNSLRFVPGLYHEDAIWGYMIIYKASKIKFIEKPVYVYRIRESGSIMSSTSVKSAYDYISGHKILMAWMSDNVLLKDQKLFQYLVFGLIKSLLDLCKGIVKTKEYRHFMKENKKYIMKQAFSAYRCSLNDFSLLTIAFSPDFFTTLCKIRVYFKKNYA